MSLKEEVKPATAEMLEDEHWGLMDGLEAFQAIPRYIARIEQELKQNAIFYQMMLDKSAHIAEQQETINRIQGKSSRRRRALRDLNKSYMLIDRWYRDAHARAKALNDGNVENLTYGLQARVHALEGHLAHAKHGLGATRVALARLIETTETLSDQQAMPDPFYVAELIKARKVLPSHLKPGCTCPQAVHDDGGCPVMHVEGCHAKEEG